MITRDVLVLNKGSYKGSSNETPFNAATETLCHKDEVTLLALLFFYTNSPCTLGVKTSVRTNKSNFYFNKQAPLPLLYLRTQSKEKRALQPLALFSALAQK